MQAAVGEHAFDEMRRLEGQFARGMQAQRQAHQGVLCRVWRIALAPARNLHAPDAKLAIQMAREVYTRRQEGSSIWVVPSDQITASDPGDKDMYFDPMEDKVYRHPTFYHLPESVDHM